MPSAYNCVEKEWGQRLPIWRRLAKAPADGLAVCLTSSEPFEILTMVQCGIDPRRILAVDYSPQVLANLRRNPRIPNSVRPLFHTRAGDIAEVAYESVLSGRFATAVHLDFKNNSASNYATVRAVASSGFMRRGLFAVSHLNGREALSTAKVFVPPGSFSRLTTDEQTRSARVWQALCDGYKSTPVSVIWYNKYHNKNTGQSLLWAIFQIGDTL